MASLEDESGQPTDDQLTRVEPACQAELLASFELSVSVDDWLLLLGRARSGHGIATYSSSA